MMLIWNQFKMLKIIKYNLLILLFLLALPFAVHGQSHRASYAELKAKYTPQSSPEKSIRLELNLLAQGIYCYDLSLFDSDWRRKGKKIIYSSGYKHTANKFDVTNRVYKEGKYAIIYYPDNKSEGPDFLYRTSDGWIIDRTAVWEYIHNNYSNTGWFAYEGDYPYLSMLKKIFNLEKIKLDNGVWGYQIK